MRRMVIFSVALVAFLASVAAAAGSASAARLTLSSGGEALATPDAFEAEGLDSLEVTTSKGSLECEEYFRRSGLELQVLTNAKGTDELAVDRLFGDYQEPCRSFTGNASFDLESLSGPLKLRANTKATAGAATLLIVYEHLEYHNNVECFYSATSLKGSNTASATRQELAIELGGKLKLDSSRSSQDAKQLCPNTAELSWSLPLTEEVESEEVVEAQTGR
jgi:hypothetical protein